MTTLREAAQQALEALQNCANGEDDVLLTRDALANLRAALAEPVQEPVAWMYEHDGMVHDADNPPFFMLNRWATPVNEPYTETPLYTAPPQRKPLTEEAITQCFADAGAIVEGQLWVKVIRNVERAHGIT